MVQLVRVSTCNLNQWSLDFSLNLRNIQHSITLARQQHSRFRTGPELELSGYGCEDHYYEADTLLHCWQALLQLLTGDWTDDMLVDVGMPYCTRACATTPPLPAQPPHPAHPPQAVPGQRRQLPRGALVHSVARPHVARPAPPARLHHRSHWPGHCAHRHRLPGADGLLAGLRDVRGAVHAARAAHRPDAERRGDHHQQQRLAPLAAQAAAAPAPHRDRLGQVRRRLPVRQPARLRRRPPVLRRLRLHTRQRRPGRADATVRRARRRGGHCHHRPGRHPLAACQRR